MNNKNNNKKFINIPDLLWNCWCIFSIIGIWPRFIEPFFVRTSRIQFPIKNLSPSLAGLKILQFSDLHLFSKVPNFFLKHLSRKINKLHADMIVFTGDFLCFSQLDETEGKRLKEFLCSLHAPQGCFAIFGNHDYEKFVSVNSEGDYDVSEIKATNISRAFKRLFAKIVPTKRITERARLVKENEPLTNLLKETPFKLLNNTSIQVTINDATLNLCGLGEYMLGKCLPEIAFASYNKNYPGIILSHNPDSISLLKNYPGDLILSGHTHGGQICLPWILDKFALVENKNLLRGLAKVEDKSIYINRGVGSAFVFRWFATPELLLLTLEES